MNIVQYLDSLLSSFPQLGVIKLIVAAIMILVVFDGIVSLIFGSLLSLFRGR